jgi:lipid-binding SYLF domain-containing protein
MRRSWSLLISTVALSVGLAGLAGCATAPTTQAKRQDLKEDASQALAQMRTTDPTLDRHFLNSSYAYAVFPHIGKGGYVVGGSYGRGIVYRHGIAVGYTDISKASIGFQFGGQSYMEVLAFESEGDYERFASGKLTLTADVSAVILKSGAAQSAKYASGVAVFVQPIGGAMVEAALGGQQFTFQKM